MRIIYFIFYASLGNYLFSQTCVFDGKVVAPLGLTEIVNKEALALYRCSNGHQMWLAEKEIKVSESPLSETIGSRKKGTKTLSSNLNVVPKNENVNSLVFPAVKKRETMSKKEYRSSKFSSSLNIQKFGLETLLHKKIESNRQFSEKLNNERAELLHLMFTQNKLFNKIDNNKFSFKKHLISSYPNILYVVLSISFTSYLIF